MTIGEVFLEAISTGVITDDEMAWVAAHQGSFSRAEEAAALRLGRLVDAGAINLGCRLTPRLRHHRQIARDWSQPLGGRRHLAAA